MRLIAALSVPVLTVGFGALVVAPASAHTPDLSASCSGVHVGATAYDANMANRWSVTIDGVTQSGTFGSSLDQTFPVPQDGTTVAWSAFVEAADGTYHGERSGTVGPCGTPPATDECVDLPGDQPAGTACTPPPDVERVDAQQLSDCAVTFAGTSYGAGDLAYTEQYTDTYVFNEQTNVWDLVTDTEPTIADVVFTPWTTQQQVAHGCVDQPGQPPAEQSSHHTTHLDCADDVRITTTTTTTTPYVYDDQTNTWVLGTPVEHTTTDEQPVQAGVCDNDNPDQGVSASEATSHNISRPSPTTAIPTSVAAGVSGSPSHGTALAAVSSPVAPSNDQRTPALLLLLTGAAALALGAFRIRRS